MSRKKAATNKPKVGDKVMWEDDEEGFTGIYEITALGKDDAWLYSDELGTEVQVMLCEIEGRIIED